MKKLNELDIIDMLMNISEDQVFDLDIGDTDDISDTDDYAIVEKIHFRAVLHQTKLIVRHQKTSSYSN